MYQPAIFPTLVGKKWAQVDSDLQKKGSDDVLIFGAQQQAPRMESVEEDSRTGSNKQMNLFLKLALICAVLLQLTACSQTVQWKEEVRLSDGRQIVVTQKKLCEGGNYNAETGATCIARDAWLTLNLPEVASTEIVWHESLTPMVVDIHQGRLYVIGLPPHTLEFRTYGATNPPYFGFIWHNGGWERIPFSEIPKNLYEANMLIESIPQKRTKYLTLAQKNSIDENGNSVYPSFLRRIDPKHTMPSH